MILIGENINVLSKRIGPALKELDPKPIQQMALELAEAGMDMIDVNLGPARKEGDKLMGWVVGVIQEVVGLPLSLDTSNVEAIEAGIKISRARPLINSISARPERIEALMPLAKKYKVPFIALTLGIEGVPRDANERGLLAAQLMAEAAGYEIPEEDIWIDPVVLPINSQQLQVQGCTEFAMMLPELAPNCKSTCGLSNISNGVPGALRGIINRTYLAMLKGYGLHSAIVDAYDRELIAIARDERKDIESLVQGVAAGEHFDLTRLSKEEADYVKTARIILGQTLYSDSWLEI